MDLKWVGQNVQSPTTDTWSLSEDFGSTDFDRSDSNQKYQIHAWTKQSRRTKTEKEHNWNLIGKAKMWEMDLESDQLKFTRVH